MIAPFSANEARGPEIVEPALPKRRVGYAFHQRRVSQVAELSLARNESFRRSLGTRVYVVFQVFLSYANFRESTNRLFRWVSFLVSLRGS